MDSTSLFHFEWHTIDKRMNSNIALIKNNKLEPLLKTARQQEHKQKAAGLKK